MTGVTKSKINHFYLKKGKSMATIKIDVSDPSKLEAPKFEPLEPGVYNFEVVNDVKIEQANSGNNIIKLELEETESRKKIWDNLVLIPTCQWKVYQFCKSAGIEIGDDGSIDTDLFKGSIARAAVVQSTYKKPDTGETRLKNEIQRYMYEGQDEE